MLRGSPLWAFALGAGIACAPVAVVPDAGTEVDLGDAGVDELTRDPLCPADVAWVTGLSGRVVDEDQAGLAAAIVQACTRTDQGRLLCLRPSATADDGAFTIDISASARCMERATMRVLKPLTDTTTSYCSVPLPLDSSTVELPTPYPVLTTTRATTLPSGAVDDVRTVEFAGGLALDVVPSALPPDAYERLAARVIDDVSEAPACLREDAPPMSTMIGFSPELDVSGNGTRARIANQSGLAAGSSVPIYVLGSIDCRLADSTLVKEGKWERIADGVVSDDGTIIEVAGVPCLTWMGVGLPG